MKRLSKLSKSIWQCPYKPPLSERVELLYVVCYFFLVVGDVGYVDIIEDSHGKSKVKFWSLVSLTLCIVVLVNSGIEFMISRKSNCWKLTKKHHSFCMKIFLEN